jgi:hypothetical protein
MIYGLCPYCHGKIEIEIAAFAPSTRIDQCPHCERRYRVVDIPMKEIVAISLEEYSEKYEK